MKTKKLVSMIDFVLQQNNPGLLLEAPQLDRIKDYARFLKQPVKLEMFVKCDKFGDALQSPDGSTEPNKIIFKNCYLFENFFISNGDKLFFYKGLLDKMIIDDLVKYDLEFTENAQNLITSKNVS